MKTVRVRTVDHRDVVEIADIEASAQPSPWSRQQIAHEIDLPQNRFLVATIEDRIAGYLVAWEIAGEIEIHNVVAAPAFRRRGVAAALLKDILGYAGQNNVQRLFLEVRISNEAAIKLYTKFGFEECGRRRGYYRDGEDALLMERANKTPSRQDT